MSVRGDELGAQHPRVAAIVNSLGNASPNAGDLDAAAGDRLAIEPAGGDRLAAVRRWLAMSH